MNEVGLDLLFACGGRGHEEPRKARGASGRHRLAFDFWRSQRQLSASLKSSISNGHSPSCVFVHSQMLSLPWLTLPPGFLRPQRRSSNPASLSRNLHAVAPSLVHTLSQEENSILSVATGDNHIYSGSQNQNISVRRPFPCPHAR